jgi:hypothetical protein
MHRDALASSLLAAVLLLLTACGSAKPDAMGFGGGLGTSGTSGNGGTSGNDGTSASAGAAGVGGAGAGGAGAGAAGRGGAGAGAGAGGTGGRGGAGAGAGGSAGASYSTNFDLTESPLSEKGAWHHTGLDWTLVDAGDGLAFGTQPLGVARQGPTGYDDSYAYLAGFPADQQASGVLHFGNIDASCTHEVEIILRWDDSAHVARGYECNLAFDGGYAQIVRWNGAIGDYTYLADGSVPGGVHEGDTLSASVVGDQITLRVNDVVRASAKDATFATGNPGVAFWRGMNGCGTKADFGFTSFSASAAVK